MGEKRRFLANDKGREKEEEELRVWREGRNR
jgi:hypothetical protein